MEMRNMICEQFPFPNYDWNDYQFLGEGSFGKVFKVKNTNTRDFVAVKQIQMKKIIERNLLQSLMGEIKVMREVESPYTIRLIDSHIGTKFSYMVLELCESDLQKKMQKSQHTFSEEECLDIFGEILKGMKVLVDHSYIHRDIKPANVLIQGSLYKIADYGFARKADIFCKTKMAEFCGTPIYMAPQLLWGEPYTAKCDVWSLGLMLYELLYGCPPWPCLSIDGYIEGIKKRPLSFPYKVAIGRGTRDFLVRALTVRESLRMNWEEVFNHEIIKDHKVGSILQMEPPPAHIRHILSSLQREVELKQVDLIQIFARYQNCSALDKKTFTALIKDISPAITTHELNQIYQYMDLDKNGFIEFDEWKSVVCDMNYHDNYQESRMLEELACIVKMRHIDLVKLFKKFDKNGSGALDHPEFQAFMKAIGPKYDKIHINKMFKLFDRNQNGLINFDEFIQSLQYPNADINMERGQRNINGLKHHLLHSRIPVEGFLPLADTNRDYKMDEKEFSIVLDKINYKIAPEEVKEVFYCMDKNHSGLINAQELMQALK